MSILSNLFKAETRDQKREAMAALHQTYGDWFDPKFAGERMPRLDEFLRWIKGRAKLFLDVKWGDLNTLVAIIRETGVEQDCFFWFRLPELAAEFRALAPDLQLKVNAQTTAAMDTAVAQLQANII